VELVANTEIEIVADAFDIDGLIEQVEFFVNGVSIGTVIGAPYIIPFFLPSPGDYVLTAVATDNTGNSDISAAVTITSATVIGIAPTISITAPDNGADFFPGEDIEIIADAFDEDGLIEEVEFFVNGVSIGSASAFPYSVGYLLGSPGDYNITAIATDNTGNSAISLTVTVTSIGAGGGIGEVILTAGASPITGAEVIVTGAEILKFPELSVAIAVRV